MKICIAQPEYSVDYSRSDELFEKQLELFGKCDESMDLIVFPESCDIPCLAKTKENSEQSARKYTQRLLDTARETAKRCNAMVFVNARSSTEKDTANEDPQRYRYPAEYRSLNRSVDRACPCD